MPSWSSRGFFFFFLPLWHPKPSSRCGTIYFSWWLYYMISSRWLLQTPAIIIGVSFLTFWSLVPIAYCLHLLYVYSDKPVWNSPHRPSLPFLSSNLYVSHPYPSGSPNFLPHCNRPESAILLLTHLSKQPNSETFWISSLSCSSSP